MPEISANFVVEPLAVTISSETNTISVDAEPINLNVFSLGFTDAGGSPGNIQYNSNGTLAGASNTIVSNGNVSFTNISNLKIANGSNGYFLQTDGTGNLTWAPGTSNATGNGTAAGANTQVQVTDGAGNFVAAPGFTFDNSTNVFTTPGNAVINGNITATANITGNFFIGDGSQLTNVNAQTFVVSNTSANSSNTFYPVFVSQTGNVVAEIDNFGNVLTYIPNTGTLNAHQLTTTLLNVNEIINTTGLGSEVTINDDLVVNGNTTGGNFIGRLANGTSNIVIPSANSFIGFNVNGNLRLTIGNGAVTANAPLIANGVNAGNILQANYIQGTLVANSNAQPNITSVGTLTSLTTNGNINIAHVNSSMRIPTANGNINFYVFDPNTPIAVFNGTTGLTLNTSIIRLGANANGSFSIGPTSGNTNQGLRAIAIGDSAGRLNQGNGAVALGYQAQDANAGANSVAVGYQAGLGFAGAGQGANAIAVGYQAGYATQGINAIAIGSQSGRTGQGNNAVAIGIQAGDTNQGLNSIAIGQNAGITNQPNNSIVINATGSNLNPSTANTFNVKPIRFSSGPVLLLYDPTSGEIVYDSVLSNSFTVQSNLTSNNLVVNNFANISGNLRSNNLVVNNFANISGNLSSNNLVVTNFANVSGNVNANNINFTNNLSGANANISNVNLIKYQETVIAGGNANGTITPNAAAGTIYNYTLTGNITLSTLANAVAGTSMTIILTQDSVGNRLLTSTMKFAGNVRTLSTIANSIDIMSVFYDGSTYYAALSKGYA